MQGHNYEENKLEKYNAHWNNFVVKDASLKSGGTYQDDILKDDSPYKGISTIYTKLSN